MGNLFKVNNKDNRTTSDVVLVSLLLLTLNRFLTLFWCFYCWLWIVKWRPSKHEQVSLQNSFIPAFFFWRINKHWIVLIFLIPIKYWYSLTGIFNWHLNKTVNWHMIIDAVMKFHNLYNIVVAQFSVITTSSACNSQFSLSSILSPKELTESVG